MKKRTLTATGGTDDGDELAGSNSEIQMSNGFHDHTAARSIPFGEIADFYACTAHVNGPPIPCGSTADHSVETFHDLPVLLLYSLSHGTEINREQLAILHYDAPIDDHGLNVAADGVFRGCD